MIDNSYVQSLLDEFELDLTDAAEAELESLLTETQRGYIPKGGGLVSRLSASGEGSFPVSSDSLYSDPYWVLDTHKFAYSCTIHFSREIPGADELKKALAFYLLPESSVNAVKSSRSTLTYCNNFAFIEKYIFKDNHLTVCPENLAMINQRLINNALDRAREDESPNQYLGLFRMIKLWIMLSEQNFIPDHLRIAVPLKHIESPERRVDMYATIRGTYQTWVSFSEQDLGHLMEYALFWLEKAAPELAKIQPAIEKTLTNNQAGKISRSKIDEELEASYRVIVEGRTVMELNRTELCGTHPGMNWSYSWKTNWAAALDHVRNAVFIMIALISGARASELAPLSVTDISNDKPDNSGNYWLRIVRWKTAADPNYNGEVEYLPLPTFVAECAIAYDKLRNIGRKSERHWLFRGNAKGKPEERDSFTTQVLHQIVRQLREELPIERLHIHRFRKTIAEILINQDERNIDLIRALFGHKTFKMTMQYIARNPAMVRSVALTIEQSYTEELKEIIAAIRTGSYSGQAAIRISQQISTKPGDFEGRRIPLSIFDYVSNLLAGGKPLFIKRTAVGTYCVTAEKFRPNNLPPCIKGRDFGDEIPRPDPSNCHYECRKIVVLDKARSALEDNIKFYERILESANANFPDRTRFEILAKVRSYRHHLNNLKSNEVAHQNAYFDDRHHLPYSDPRNQIPAVEV